MPNHAILTRYVKECYTASEDFLKEATILMRGQIVIAPVRSLSLAWTTCYLHIRILGDPGL
ncbi:hypothetical protein NC653_028084 [Populus alba x Populus x berolinensis]|uniref:Uncharacterized protein n=1 Tax=Populus alba x Populus x berolinensis TaxID=444605 RepID=A0AAD6M765_9ROSI|nr:hypothetical protein NC653_028084 [Populus alba x Populus x berolinensis]